METTHLLELTVYTDPYCTWCWGEEPILRKIEEVYGDQIKIRYVMGGLVADIKNFSDPGNRIGGSKWYEQVAAHWLEASSRHGMPVDEQVFFDLKDKDFSTHPANIAYKAAQLQDEIMANKFLRRMREGAAAERRAIGQLDVQVELAKEVGLDSALFAADIKSGKAKKAFDQDLTECRIKGVRGFPTFLVRNINEEQEILLRGYRKFDQLVEVFDRLTANTLNPAFPTANKDTILAFVRKYNKVTLREISEVFTLGQEETNEYLAPLISAGSLHKEEVGNGFFLCTVSVL